MQEAEKVSRPFFSKNELIEQYSVAEFERLTGLKILSYCKPTKDTHESVRKPRCHCGSPLTVVEVDSDLEGFCPEHPDDGPWLLDKDDRISYEFPIKILLEHISSANDFEGQLKEISGSCYYLGYRIYPETQVGFVFVRKISKSAFVELSGLKSICDKDRVLVILTLSPDEDIILQKNLENQSVIQLPLLDVLNTDNFALSINHIISDHLKKLGIAEGTQLTKQQRLDYDKFGYKCYDQISFPHKHGKGRNYLININGKEISIQYHEMLFLIFLAIQLKQNNGGGWISGEQLEKQEVTRDSIAHIQRLRSDLKKQLNPYLHKMNSDEFLQNDKKGNYRLSVHPDFVYLADEWSEKKFDTLKNAVIKERKRRKKYAV
ncbi:MAG: hypothetical protein H7A34_01670 [bacterium]|nr:hypothetical protein [bacterium]